MIRRFVSYDGYEWGNEGYSAILSLEDLHDGWRTDWDDYPRPGAHPALGAGAISARRITANFTFPNGTSAASIYQAFNSLMGRLAPDQPHDPDNPRYLIAELMDGLNTPVRVPAVIETPHGMTPNAGRNGFLVTFLTTDPAWRRHNLLDAANPDFPDDLTHWAERFATSGITYTAVQDRTVYYTPRGSLKLNLTANTSGIGATVDYWNTTYLPVTVGADYALTAWSMTENANITPQLRIDWFDSAQAALSSSVEADWTPTIDTWSRRTFVATAPASAVYARVTLRAYCDTAGPTGALWFDDVRFIDIEQLTPVNGNNPSPTWQTLNLSNDGHARAWPVLSFDVTGQEAAGGLYEHRRTIVLTNNNEADITNEAFEVDLGDSSGWAETASFDSDWNVWVFRDGKQVHRELVGFDNTHSMMWIFIDHLPGNGGSTTLELVYGGTSGPSLNRLVGSKRTAFDIGWQVATVTTGSTASAVEFPASTFAYADQYDDGLILMLTGALAGSKRMIASNDTDTINVSPAFGSAPSNGDLALIRKSWQVDSVGVDANRLTYNVLRVERSNLYRGLWYLNTGQNRPDNVLFDTPGAWEPFLFLDNRDEKNQLDFTRENVGTLDSFAILDASRAPQGGDTLENEGAADGIRFASIWPITSWSFNGSFDNPNGMGHAWFGGRPNETRDWSEVRDVTTATVVGAGPSTFSTVANALDAGTHHLCAVLQPRDDALIDPSWQKITGGRTSGGTAGGTSVSDATLAGRYVSGQFTGGTLVVTAGAGVGQRRTLTNFTASGATFFWSGGLATALDDTSRFEVTLPPLTATLKTSTVWHMQLDLSDLAIGSLSSEAANYPARMTITVDGGEGDRYPHHRLRVGIADRVLFLASAAYTLKLDCPNKRAWVEDGNGEELVDVTAYVVSEEVLGPATTDVRNATEWLPMTPGVHNIKINNAGLTTFALTAGLDQGYLG